MWVYWCLSVLFHFGLSVNIEFLSWKADDTLIPDVSADCPEACLGNVSTLEEAEVCLLNYRAEYCTGSAEIHVSGTEDLAQLCIGEYTNITQLTFPIAPQNVLTNVSSNTEVFGPYTGQGVVITFSTNVQGSCKLHIHESPSLPDHDTGEEETIVNCGLSAIVNETLPLEKATVTLSEVLVPASLIYPLGDHRMALAATSPLSECGETVTQMMWDINAQVNWFLTRPSIPERGSTKFVALTIFLYLLMYSM